MGHWCIYPGKKEVSLKKNGVFVAHGFSDVAGEMKNPRLKLQGAGGEHKGTILKNGQRWVVVFTKVPGPATHLLFEWKEVGGAFKQKKVSAKIKEVAKVVETSVAYPQTGDTISKENFVAWGTISEAADIMTKTLTWTSASSDYSATGEGGWVIVFGALTGPPPATGTLTVRHVGGAAVTVTDLKLGDAAGLGDEVLDP